MDAERVEGETLMPTYTLSVSGNWSRRMKTIMFMLLAGCVTNDTLGPEGIDLVPEVGNVYDCDLITELGREPYTPRDQIEQVHDVSHPCIGADPALADYKQAWQDGVCTPMVLAFGPPGGGCYGSCTMRKTTFCLVRGD